MASSSDGPSLSERLVDLTTQRPVTVLHVDDDPDFTGLVASYLEHEDDSLEVLTESSAEAGLERLETEPVDCIVSDYEMPRTNGLEFLDAVREDHPDLPFVLFTGKGSEEIASQAISAGVTDYLQKVGGTGQYAVLANRIGNVVQQYRASKEIERGFSAIETAREGIAFLDEEGTFLYANPAYTDVYGYDRGELIGEHWEVLYPDEHVHRVYDEIIPSVPEQGRWTGENVHLRKDGTRLVVSHALAYCSEGTLLCLIRDITDEKETKRTLEWERRRFAEFVEAVEEYAIFSLDPEGFVTSWNRGAERLKGYDPEEIVGEHFSVFYPEEKAEADYPDGLLETAVAEGSVQDTGWRVRKDGSRFWADVVITAVFDEDGTHRGFLKVTRDMTQQRRATRELETEREFLDRSLDAVDDVFYALDAEGNLVRVTDRAAAVTGYSREELLSMSPLDLFAPEDRPRIREDIEDALETGSSTVEADLVTKGGRTVPFEFRKRRLTDAEGNAFLVGIGRDVSERKRRERQLERQLAQLEHFGSVLSHDLRTPLNTAQGRVELARETGEDEHLEHAATALERLDDLITDLAAVLRDAEFVGDVTTVEVEDALRSIWGALDTADAALAFESSGSIRADEDAFKRLVENLLQNALEHGGDGVTVTVGMLPDGFYVEDDGPGVPDGERDRVFEVGYSTKPEGTGLGLASVRQLVIAHGWEIEVTEGSDGGARFEITGVDVA